VDTTQPDAATPPTAKAQLDKATMTCEACLTSECKSERSSCGNTCDTLTWPVSPDWNVPDVADGFSRCLFQKCAVECDALWGCVDKYSLPAPKGPYNVTVRVVDPISNSEPVENAKVTACGGADPGCAAGVGMESMDVTDAGGRARLTVPADFFGYFQIDGGDKFLPSTVMWSQPTYRADTGFGASLFQKIWVEAVTKTLRVTRDPDRGHVIFRTQNCLPLRYLESNESEAAAQNIRVSFSPSAGTDTFYTTYGLAIDPKAPTTLPGGNGYGGALNFEPGNLAIVGSLDDRQVTNATLPLRANAMGLVFLAPNTKPR
jgi:hypothetical protein